jgi:hypothetical protein
MSGTYFGNKEDLNEEVQYRPTDTEDTNTTITSNKKHRCRKRSTTESDSEGTPTLQPKKKCFYFRTYWTIEVNRRQNNRCKYFYQFDS